MTDLISQDEQWGTVRASLNALASPAGFARVVTWPSKFNSRMAGINLGEIKLWKWQGGRGVTTSRTPPQVFGDFSTALSSPEVTYWVTDSGSDANDGLSEATAFRTPQKASTALTASAFANAMVMVKGSALAANRATGFSGTGTAISPTKPMAWMLYSTDKIFNTTDSGFAPTADATDTNTYSQSIANMEQVVDLLGTPDRFNRPPRVTKISTSALANITPSTWSLVAGTFKMRRADGLQPTLSNTAAYRAVANFTLTSHVSQYFGSVDGGQWVFGGGNLGGLRIAPTSNGPQKQVVVLDNCVTIRNAFRSISVERWHGYVLNYGGFYGASTEDGSNIHNRATITVQTAGSGYAVSDDITLNNGWVLTVASVSSGGVATFTEKTGGTSYSPGVATQSSTTGTGSGATFLFSYAADVVYVDFNAQASDFGIPGSVSCNAFTPHENCLSIAFGGRYSLGSNGLARGIDASAMVMVGSIMDTDRGDVWLGAASTPIKSLIRVGVGAEAHLDDILYIGDPGTYQIYNEGTVYEKNAPINQPRKIYGPILDWVD